MTKSLLLLCLLLHPFAASAQLRLTALTVPVAVEAEYRKQLSGPPCDHYDVKFQVAGAIEQQSRNASDVMVCTGQTLEDVLRKQVSFLAPYLTIRLSCGSGNGWACNERALYKVTKGAATRLGRIDDLLFATGQTLFLKIFDWHEVNDLVGHSGRPIRVVMRLTNDRLTYDPELTWILNHEAFERYQAFAADDCSLQSTAEFGVDCKIGLLFKATLAKLTGRENYARTEVARAKVKLLGPNEYDKFVSMVSEISPTSIQGWIDRGR